MEETTTQHLFGLATEAATHPVKESDVYSGYSITPDKLAVEFQLRGGPHYFLVNGRATEFQVDTFNLESLKERNANAMRGGFDNSMTKRAIDDLQRAQNPAIDIKP